MKEFSYVDIFDTKGIEYIVIISFLLLIVPIWRYLNKPVAVKVPVASGKLSEILHVPHGLFYSKFHTWAFLENSGFAKIGANSLLVQMTGDVSLQMLKSVGAGIKKGEVFASIMRDNKKLELSSPVSGKIQAINNSLLSDGAINHDPYENGWICKVTPEKWQEETNSFYVGHDACEWINKELVKFKEFILDSVGNPANLVMQEGGELRNQPLSELPEEVWNDFQEKFLKA
jgi:glycine cleavage system H protein